MSKKDLYVTSSGHKFSTSKWLDLHFDAAFPEYKLIVEQIGIKHGWSILDAGCGNGRFIDLLDKCVGTIGQISAFDLAPENIKIVEKKIASSIFSSKVTADIGNVTNLPYADNAFDAVWCAAVTQYLSEEQLTKTLTEFNRVVKPGGVIAIKEYDGISSFYYPTIDLTLLWRSVAMMDAFDKQKWFVHPLEMQGLMKNVGLQNVSQRTVLVERRQPLNSLTKRYIQGLIQVGEVSWASMESLSKEDQKKWNDILSPQSSKYILKQPNFYWREGHIVSIGRKA